MARKKKHPEHVNHERWLVSYADFMTLLFAFFVVMFAVSQVDSKKVGRFTESFSKAVGIELFPSPGLGLLPGGESPIPASSPVPNPGDLALPPELLQLKTDLLTIHKKADLPAGLAVVVRRNELVIRLADSVVFRPGDDTLDGTRAKVLQTVAKELVAHKVELRIEGHTDDRPIHTSRFRSNWELSTARATAVVMLFAAAGIGPERLSAAGYGEFHPIASNKTDEGRAQNRRIDVVVSAAREPSGSGAAPAPPPAEAKDAHPKDAHSKAEP